MFSNAANRYGVKSTRRSLKLKRQAESEERQTSAREEVVSDGRDTSAPPEEEFWIDDHFQQTLKTLIRKFVEAENELYALQERIKRLKDSKSEGKVPTGLIVHRINAKGRNSQALQNRFDAILREAELKLLDTTIEALTEDEQQYKERCATEKENVTATIDAWRSSFQASEATLSIDADHFVASAKSFVNDFYFQCVAIRTSKKVAGDIKKAAKEANRVQRMETEFQPNEQSIKDMVTREVQKELSKLQTAKNKQSSRKPADDRGPHRNSRSASRGRNKAKSGHSPNGKTTQKRQSRSRTRNSQTSHKQQHSVTFSGSRSSSGWRRQPSKNAKSRANGSVK